MNEKKDVVISEDLQKKVYAEQVQLLYSSMSAAVAANIVTSVLFISIQWLAIDKITLLIWFSISFIIIFLRAILLAAYNKASPNTDEIHQWGKLFLIGSSASGLMLGSAGIFLFPAGEPIYQLTCGFVLLGMSAGAMTSLSFGKYNFPFYISLTLLPYIISLALEGTDLTLILIPMVMLMFVFLIKSSKNIYNNTEQNILLLLQSAQREKELLKSNQKNELHIQKTPLGVIEWDTDFKVIEWNTSAENIFGYTKEEAMGCSANELIIADKDKNKNKVDERWQQLINISGGTHFENENITKHGSIIMAEWFNTPIIDDAGITISVTSMVQDISERKRTEKMKSEFVSTVSHELRTPLTSIKGSLGLILGGAVGTYSNEVSDMLETASSNAERLLLLINDILDMKKIEEGDFGFNFDDYELMPLIEEALEANKNFASQYNVTFKLSNRLENKKTHIDKARFLQIMTNLLSNAAKFSPKGEKVDISVTQNINMARIEVTDYGEGIAEEFQEKIFDRFTQHNSSNTRRTGGTGLGLAISKVIIERLDGNIGFESEMNIGSTFYIELPLVKSAIVD